MSNTDTPLAASWFTTAMERAKTACFLCLGTFVAIIFLGFVITLTILTMIQLMLERSPAPNRRRRFFGPFGGRGRED